MPAISAADAISSRTSVVMLTRDRLAYTRKALASLEKTLGPIEWILVDTGSADQTVEWLERWAAIVDSPRTVIDARGVGAAAARNLGWRCASGEHVVFLDNDVYLDEDLAWLEKLLALPRANPRVAIAAPMLLFPGFPDLVQSAGGGITARARFGLLGRGLPPSPELAAAEPRAWAPTAAMLVRRSVLAELDGFDESFDPVPICEDLELCCRVRAAGYEIAYTGEARLRHFEGTTFGRVGDDKRTYWERHARVIKARWEDVMTSGPVHSDSDIVWRPVEKDYSNLEAPGVWVADQASAAPDSELSFFASRRSLPSARPPVVRVGVIGCGQVALRGALPGLSHPGSPLTRAAAPFLNFGGCDGVRIAAVADAHRGRAQAAAAAASSAWLTDGIALLDTVPIEGVLVCTPPTEHARYAHAALERNVAVLVEKPAAADERELDRLLEAVETRPGTVAMINLPWEFHPGVWEAAAAVADGHLGEVRRATVCFEHPGPERWAPGAPWYRYPGGGVVRDLALHAVAALERVLGGGVEGLIPDGDLLGDRARASGRIGSADVCVDVGWDALRPRFSIAVEGTRRRVELELIPYGSDAIAGGPYRHFVDCLNSGDEPMTAIAARAGAVRAVLGWASTTGAPPEAA